METMIGEDTNLTVERLLEDEEIQAYRDNYTALMEHDKIECEARSLPGKSCRSGTYQERAGYAVEHHAAH